MRLIINENRLAIGENRFDIPLTPIHGYDPANSAYLWYDASDASSIDVDSSNNVLAMYDKGSYGIDLSPANDNPVFNQNQQNGLSTITFSNNYLATAVSDFSTNDKVLLVAFNPTSVSNQYGSVVSFTSDTDADWQLQANDGALWYGALNATIGKQVFDPNASTGTPQLLSFTSIIADGEVVGYKNGQQVFTMGNYVGWGDTAVKLHVGTNRNIGRYLGMDFYEFILDDIANLADATQYLIDKWGIV